MSPTDARATRTSPDPEPGEPAVRFRSRPRLGQVEVSLDGGESWFVVSGLPPRELESELRDSPMLQRAAFPPRRVGSI